MGAPRTTLAPASYANSPAHRGRALGRRAPRTRTTLRAHAPPSPLTPPSAGKSIAGYKNLHDVCATGAVLGVNSGAADAFLHAFKNDARTLAPTSGACIYRNFLATLANTFTAFTATTPAGVDVLKLRESLLAVLGAAKFKNDYTVAPLGAHVDCAEAQNAFFRGFVTAWGAMFLTKPPRIFEEMAVPEGAISEKCWGVGDKHIPEFVPAAYAVDKSVVIVILGGQNVPYVRGFEVGALVFYGHKHYISAVCVGEGKWKVTDSSTVTYHMVGDIPMYMRSKGLDFYSVSYYAACEDATAEAAPEATAAAADAATTMWMSTNEVREGAELPLLRDACPLPSSPASPPLPLFLGRRCLVHGPRAAPGAPGLLVLAPTPLAASHTLLFPDRRSASPRAWRRTCRSWGSSRRASASHSASRGRRCAQRVVVVVVGGASVADGALRERVDLRRPAHPHTHPPPPPPSAGRRAVALRARARVEGQERRARAARAAAGRWACG